MLASDFVSQFCTSNGWAVVDTVRREGRPEELYDPRPLGLLGPALRYLEACYPRGIYRHQMEAIKHHLRGRDVAVTTGTASGKSVVFYVSALRLFGHDPAAKVLAVYPLKALAREQEQRWAAALDAGGCPAQGVARLDGDVPTSRRHELLRRASVVVATPDVLHAWLLPHVGDGPVWDFLGRLRLVVMDEIHVYTGVFGSNTAFLLRRLEHLMALAGRKPTYIAASATVRDPAVHLRSLFGRQFRVIGEEHDTSGRHEMTAYFVVPDKGRDLMGGVSRFLQEMAAKTSARFIVFVDSRRQTELVATIAGRAQKASEEPPEEAPSRFEHLQKLDILPYRAGFEETDRAVIQDRLSNGTLRGVVSTSALELGIDIPHLDVGVLVGVPRSATSLMQRIGRVGRRGPGVVVIINNGDVYSEAMFRNPSEVFQRPPAEGALHLENARIQYIHAMCLARQGGEHDQALCRAGSSPEDGFVSPVSWPPGFLDLCARERSGEIPSDLQSMKMEAGDAPHLVFPLRDVESQFSVEYRSGPEQYALGSLSYGQLMREAYPGAVYYYATTPYRVFQVLVRSRTVRVRRERYYTTRPQMLPVQVYPNLSPGAVYRTVCHGELWLVEASLQIREAVCGYKERRGPTEISERYPLDSASTGVVFGQNYFARNYFTTGVVVFHPVLADDSVNVNQVAELLYECYLIEIPFERQDVGWATGRLKVARGPFEEGAPFVAIFDQTYGSLRLSGKLMDPGVMPRVLRRALELGQSDVLGDLSAATRCIEAMASSAVLPPVDALSRVIGEAAAGEERFALDRGRLVRVILPGSLGLDRFKDNEEFHIEGVFYSASGGLRYRGRHPSDTDESVRVTVPVENVVAVPGESRLGWYDPETGEILEETGPA